MNALASDEEWLVLVAGEVLDVPPYANRGEVESEAARVLGVFGAAGVSVEATGYLLRHGWTPARWLAVSDDVRDRELDLLAHL